MTDREATEATFVLPPPKESKEGKKSVGGVHVASAFQVTPPGDTGGKKPQWDRRPRAGRKPEEAQETEDKRPPWARRTRGEKLPTEDANASAVASPTDESEEKKPPWARKRLPDKPGDAKKPPPTVPDKPARSKETYEDKPLLPSVPDKPARSNEKSEVEPPPPSVPEKSAKSKDVSEEEPSVKEPLLASTNVDLTSSSNPQDQTEVRSSPEKEKPTDERKDVPSAAATIKSAAEEIEKKVDAKKVYTEVPPDKPARLKETSEKPLPPAKEPVAVTTTSTPAVKSVKGTEPAKPATDIQKVDKKPEEQKSKATQPPVSTVKARDVSKPSTPDVSTTSKARETKEPEKHIDLSTAVPEADAGSEEKQLQVGEHFLKLAESSIDEKDNTKKAVHYLICSSKQGNVEATKLLKRCKNTGRGITSENRDDVNWCLNTTAAEKKVRHAARNMFGKINQTHKSILSFDEYNSAVKGLTDNIMEQKLLLAAGKSLGDSISENDFIKSLSNAVHGKVNLTSKELQSEEDDFNNAGTFQKFVKYPRQTFTAIIDMILEFAATKGSSWVVSLIPTNQIYIMAVLFAYSFVTASLLLFVVPLFMFYILFTVLIFSSLQMFYKRKKLSDVSNMAEMLQKYDVGVNVNDTKSQYTWNSLAPYFVFFGTLPFAVISFALADKAFIPCSECCLICLVFTAFCFIGLSDEHDLITGVALTCNVLAALPTLFGNFPDIPVITSILHFVTGSIFSFDIGGGFQFNLGIPSLSYFVIPIFFIVMAMKDSFKGSYKVLIPHLVCYFWFNLMITMFSFSTWVGLLRATAGYALLPLIVPLSLFIFIGFLFYLIFRVFQTAMFGKVLLTMLLLAVPIILSQTKALFGSSVDSRLGKAKNIMMVVFGILSLFPLFFLRVPYLSGDGPTLSWWDYAKTCGLVPEYKNSIGFQTKCAPLIGSQIEWNGTVQSVRLAKVDNPVENALKAFPDFISESVRCMGGDYYPACDNKTMDSSDYHFCTMLASVGKTCHLRNYNTYEFDVTVKTGHLSIGLHAAHGFKEILTALNDEDEVNYTGTLSGNLGTLNPQVTLTSIKCVSRVLPIMVQMQAPVNIFEKVTREGIQVAFKFFWYPLFEYTPDKK